MMYRIFLDSSETKLFFTYYLFFSKILGPAFHLEGLGNCLIGLVEELALRICNFVVSVTL